MRNFAHLAFTIGAIALITGCGGSRPPFGMPSRATQERAIAPAGAAAHPNGGATHYRVIYDFVGMNDGEGPAASLIYVNGKLYGTTAAGGTGKGTVFTISTPRTEQVIYRFGSVPDGADPRAS